MASRLRYSWCLMSLNKNNFFELFGLPVAFDIDQVALKNAFLHLQKRHHPDNNHDRHAHQNTALINQAFDTLNNSDSRAVYLLELSNIQFNADKSISDEAFLMQMMQYRMDLEDAIVDKDDEQIKAIGEQVGKLLLASAKQFKTSFDNQEWQTAQTQAQKLKFLSKLHNDCTNTLNQILTNKTDDDDLYV